MSVMHTVMLLFVYVAIFQWWEGGTPFYVPEIFVPAHPHPDLPVGCFMFVSFANPLESSALLSRSGEVFPRRDVLTNNRFVLCETEVW